MLGWYRLVAPSQFCPAIDNPCQKRKLLVNWPEIPLHISNQPLDSL